MSDDRMPATGAPRAPAVWQMLCEFANGRGNCLCAARQTAPCEAAETEASRIRNRVLAELDEDRRAARLARGRPPA